MTRIAHAPFACLCAAAFTLVYGSALANPHEAAPAANQPADAAPTAASAGKVRTMPDGTIRVAHPPIPKEHANKPWPEELEAAFSKRASHLVSLSKAPARVSTTGEHEKWTYPALMFNYLAGLTEHALKGLQAPDQQAGDHRGTDGFDFYWCFTLKGQARKFFYFGDELGPDYRKAMLEGARKWTADDPKPSLELIHLLSRPDPELKAWALERLHAMWRPGSGLGQLAERSQNALFKQKMADLNHKIGEKPPADTHAAWLDWWRLLATDWQLYEEYERLTNPRPHPVYGHGTGPVGATWDPQTRGLWVDARNTDNLRAMRETTVYLFAEAAGNELVRRAYKDKLRTHVVAMYHVGVGEWDSDNYFAHTMAPYTNLYDFAKDPEVRLLAKAALDYISTAAALKYYRGGYGGPSCRDYGGASRPFGSSIGGVCWLYFGGTPTPNPKPHEDDVHHIISSYRPPIAVHHLAQRNFAMPVEVLGTKPDYNHWLPDRSQPPPYFETLCYSPRFYVGTLLGTPAAGDVADFKLLAYNSTTGVDYVIVNTDNNRPMKNAKSMVGKRAGNQIAQYGPLVIYLTRQANGHFGWQIPPTAKHQIKDGIWFIELENTWIAVHPIQTDITKAASGQNEKGLPGLYHQLPINAPLAGFALEAADDSQYKTMQAFQAAVAGRAKLDLSKLTDNSVRFTGASGKTLQLDYNPNANLPTAVIRDQKARDFAKEWDLYRSVGPSQPVSLGFKQGTLRVEAGGHIFEQTVTPEGQVNFSETTAR